MQDSKDMTIKGLREDSDFLPKPLQEAIGYACEKSPYYRSLFASLSLIPENFKTYGDFRRIPLTTKKDLSSDGALFSVGEIRPAEWVTTSGTSLQPIRIPFTDSDLKRLERNEELSLSAAGVTPKDTVLLAVAMDRLFIAGMAYYLGARKIGATVLRCGAQSVDMVIHSLLSFKPTVIIGVPSFLIKVARETQARGMELSSLGIRTLIAIGEPVGRQDYSRNFSGETLENLWKAPVLSTYASTEMATSFCECRHQRGGHYLEELLFLEILDEHQNPVAPGMPGEVVITPLGVEGYPLLRYATSDIAFFDPGLCDCGYSFGRLSPVLGRKAQMLKIKGTTVFLSAILDALSFMEELEAYFVTVFRNQDFSDGVSVKCCFKKEGIPEKEKVEQLQKKIQGLLKITLECRLSPKDQIEALQQGSGSKKRFFEDLRGIDPPPPQG